MLLGILSQFVSLICSRFLFSFAHSWFKLRAKVCIKINPSCDIASRSIRLCMLRFLWVQNNHRFEVQLYCEFP